jgi:hypothetical protein
MCAFRWLPTFRRSVLCSRFVRNVGTYLQVDMILQPRNRYFHSRENLKLHTVTSNLLGSLNSHDIMSIRWDYVSELRPPTDLLFIPQLIYELGEPWWNKNDRRKLLIRPQELSGNHTSIHLVAKQDELGQENDEFGLIKYLCSYFEGFFHML